MIKRTSRAVFLILVLAFLYAPILVLAIYSFSTATAIGAGGSFSFENYVTLFTTPELIDMIIGTVLLAVVVALISTLLGTLGALGSFYSGRKMRSVMNTMNQIPVVNADVVTGFAVCILVVVVLGVSKDTYIPLVAGLVALCAPFVYLSVMPRLKQSDPSIYEAALDLGATPRTALVKIIIPQILPGIVSGFALSITLALDDYFIAVYTKPATFDTISTYVVNATRGSHTEIKTALWALSTLIFAVVIVAVVVMNVRTNKNSDNKHKKGERI